MRHFAASDLSLEPFDLLHKLDQLVLRLRKPKLDLGRVLA
jgi:hypothetical protein